MNRIAIITGGSSGIGFCTARALADAGCTVYELSRRTTDNEGVNHITADVTDEEQVFDAVKSVMEKEGRIDILVCNAGFGISGAVEFTDNEAAKRLLDVNLFGMVNAVRAVIPIMRKQHSGRIINLSSVAGPIPIPFQTWYSVSKAAVDSFTMATANEVKQFGISVCAVLPGDMKTGFTAAREKKHEGDDIYCGRISRSVSMMEHDEQSGMTPEIAGKFIAHIALKKHVNPINTIGFQYKAFVVLAKILPYGLCNKIIGMLYAK